MKNWSVLALLFIGFISCTDNDDEIDTAQPELMGTWLLVEQNVDPGDGSGEFQKVDSEKSIEFLEEGIFKSNGTFCDMNVESTETSSGTYVINDSIVSQFSPENYLMPEGCDTEEYKVSLYIEESALILSYPCIEGCAQKYRKK